MAAPSPIPYGTGGAERVWTGIVRTINDRTGHEAELIKHPVRETTLPEVVTGYEEFSRLDLSHFDVVITGKYPAWILSHPHHVVYMMHPLRGLYDTYDLTGLPATVDFTEPDLLGLQQLMRRRPGREALEDFFGRFRGILAVRGGHHPSLAFPGPLAREIVHFLDGVALRPPAVRRHCAISRTVAARADYFPPGIGVEVIHPPPELGELQCGEFDYFFTASRIEHPKRIDLLVEAMRLVPGDVRLRIAGNGPDLDRCTRLAAGDARVDFLGRVSTDRLRGLYADALAVPFVPWQEDFGLITVEAMQSGKPVITCADSGGPTELVVSGETGLIAEPQPAQLAAAMASLAHDPMLARRLGGEARRRTRKITWEHLVRRLLGSPPRPLARPRAPSSTELRVGARPLIVVASPLVVHELNEGGGVRLFNLYRTLTAGYDVHVVSLSHSRDPARRIEMAPGFVETVVPRSPQHQARESAMSAEVGWLPISDIAASMLIAETPAYLHELGHACRGAVVVVLAHPYLEPAVRAVAPVLPMIYDANNAETELKRGVLPANAMGSRLLAHVRAVEADAVARAELVAVCSIADQAVLAREYGLEAERVVLLPNGVDTGAITYRSGAERARVGLRWLRGLDLGPVAGEVRRWALFVGGYHPPNIVAARHLIELAPTMEDVLFVLIGRHCEALDTGSLPANVLALGMVSDLTKRTLLHNADLGLNPMAGGSGTNLKLVEYFAAGLPAVSTVIGMRGLEVQPYVHVWPASWKYFAGGIRTALANPGRSERMAASARAYVEAELDWSIIGRRLQAAVTRVRRS